MSELHHFEEAQKSAGLAAVVEKLGAVAKECPSITTVDAILSTAPADALAEHDAVLIEGLAEWAEGLPTPDVDQVVGALRDHARLIREGDKK